MKSYLEHANIAFNDLEGALLFFQTAFPDFKIRHRGATWIHFGTDESYLAINKVDDKTSESRQLYASKGINHLGFVVEDVEVLGKRMEKAGYQRSYDIVIHPHRRREYFLDKEGNDYEFVEYFTDKVAERNDYELGD